MKMIKKKIRPEYWRSSRLSCCVPARREAA